MEGLSHQTAPCWPKLAIIFEAMLLLRVFSERGAIARDTNLTPGGQLVLQVASSAKIPKTMNTETQLGSVQSATLLMPSGFLQGEVNDHF